MDREVLTRASIDYDDGIRRCGGNAELYERLLAMFLDDPSYADAKRAYESGDGQALFSAVHELKGVSGNLSLMGLYESACVCVERLRAHTDADVSSQFLDLGQKYESTIEAIDRSRS